MPFIFSHPFTPDLINFRIEPSFREILSVSLNGIMGRILNMRPYNPYTEHIDNLN
jgi:hypothetical protein